MTAMGRRCQGSGHGKRGCGAVVPAGRCAGMVRCEMGRNLLEQEIEPEFVFVVASQERQEMDGRGQHPVTNERAKGDSAEAANHDPEDQRRHALG